MGLLKLIFAIIIGFDFRKPVLLTVKDDVFLGPLSQSHYP